MVIMLPETEKALRAWVKENSKDQAYRLVWNCEDDDDPLTCVTIDGNVDLKELAEIIEAAMKG